MTSLFFAELLSTLMQESKRKNPDIRAAAEKSLNELKALPNTSESQLSAGRCPMPDLKRRPNFVRPFLLACSTRNPRYAGSAIVGLQRLVVSGGLAQETLKDTLDVLRDCASLGLEVQLKILQALPPLLQNYARYLTGELLSKALHICFILLNSKTAVVSNTSAATLQQLVISVLEKVAKEDDLNPQGDAVSELPIEDGTIPVQRAALDAYHLLHDLCLLSEGQKPQFLNLTVISADFGLELIESMLSNYPDTVSSHPEQIHVIRTRLMPFIINILSERVAFSTTVRVMRLLPIIFNNMLSLLLTECEMVLTLLNHMLDPDAAILWKRVLCMEVFRGIHAEPALVRNIYSNFDEIEGKRNIIGDHLAIMVRVAAEKPAVIGLGHQSSIPASSDQIEDEVDDQAAIQAAEGTAGAAGVPMTMEASASPGISTQWSIMRVPCIDQLDKNDSPSIPAAYFYSLALTCINSFSDGLARFLLPFSVPSEPRGRGKPRQAKGADRQMDRDNPVEDDAAGIDEIPRSSISPSSSGSRLPINPLTLDKHVLYNQIRTSAKMTESCWPALLAAYSTFFHAALDSDFYHALVRSFQRFSQISGLLRLTTPRDAFLTTLSKNAIPSGLMSSYTIASSPSQGPNRLEFKNRATGLPSTENGLLPAADKSRQSLDASGINLTARNLLCLRALLHLGIALGPILQDAWLIVLETLQQADLVMNSLTVKRRYTHNGQMTSTSHGEVVPLGDVGGEIAAVNLAAERMLESCSDLPNEAFLDVISSLKNLLRDFRSNVGTDVGKVSEAVPFIKPLSHTRSISASHPSTGIGPGSRANVSVIENIARLIEYNAARLLDKEPAQNGWNMVTNLLISVVSASESHTDLRMRAAKALNNLIGMTAGSNVVDGQKTQVRYQGLAVLAGQVGALNQNQKIQNKSSRNCDLELHRLSLETLRTSLEQYGDSLLRGWNYVLAIITSAFENADFDATMRFKAQRDNNLPRTSHPLSPKLVRDAFGSLQLICSDFLTSVPPTCYPELLNATYHFCSQQDDFNISLISTSLFWNISDQVWKDKESLNLDSGMNGSPQDVSTSSDPSTLHPTETPSSAMWLHLLTLLLENSVDSRLEIRHSALHTLFGIFDTWGGRLRPSEWITCLRLSLLKIISYNEVAYQASKTTVQKRDDGHSLEWNESAVIILDKISTLLEQYLQAMVYEDDFFGIWKTFAVELQSLLHRQSLDVSSAVFTALGKILSGVGESKETFVPCSQLAWSIWQTGNPSEHGNSTSPHQSDNQTALLAYLKCFQELYSLTYEAVNLQQIIGILEQLRICATGSSKTPYSGDVDAMTPLQVKILHCLGLLQCDVAGTRSETIRTISFFVTLAYSGDNETPVREGLTHVALSRAAMDILQEYILKDVKDHDLYESGSFAQAIRSLGKPIELKYQWKTEGKGPPPWQKATTAIVTILKASLPAMQQLSISNGIISAVWRDVLACCNSIMFTVLEYCTEPSKVSKDQEFDIKAFKEIISLIIPELGSTTLSDQLRRSFAESLFQNSIIHEPHPDDLPASNQDILEGLQSIHIGRTQNLSPSPRSRMSYLLLDTLFDLIAYHDGSAKRVKLAQAAAPYLILRVGIILKAYVLDQPLRGRMPQPLSQRKELLYVLGRLVVLDSEAKAIPDAPGVLSERKKHLYRVYGLVTKAVRVSRRDEEVHQALTGVIETIAADFGV